MDLRFDDADEAFRSEVAAWFAANLTGEFAELVGAGGPGREHEHLEARKGWERRLGRDGWIGLGWPESDGGRGLSWERQVIFYEEYARAGAPGRVGHIGEQLLGPTLLMFGTAEQRRRFLPGILDGTSLWCQGYSEPGAGSDLAAVSTRAALRDGEWHIDGQKVWTSLATEADWCFVLARTEPESTRHRGLSYLLVPMDQPGIEVRPIIQLTGTSEFNEVFLDDARAAEADVVGEPGQGWKVAMGTLALERGVSTFGQQMGFAREFDDVLATARANGAAEDPVVADRLLDSWMELQVLRHSAVMTLGAPAGTTPGSEANVAKLMWAQWHRNLGELAIDVAGAAGAVAAGFGDGELTAAQRLYLFTRADTIYGGSNEVQRTVIAQRMLGLPRGSV
ncbi:acyl-CoA dehydrogenase family protein [Pseudonocardia xishanensis]|uniref:Acyl-CoA dehydrogenase family protein n=1 Tax=Pseudonocardia xishanensis TaxID=630995 RepID=A0ABP8RRX3_9PSEU